MGNPNDGWKSVLQDATVVAKLRTVGREIAFVPGWFTRVERRRSEFAGTVQGDFNVSSSRQIYRHIPRQIYSGMVPGLSEIMTSIGIVMPTV